MEAAVSLGCPAMSRLGILPLVVALLAITGCGDTDATKAKNTASTFLDALADGDGYACDQASIDTLRLCYSGPSYPGFRGAETTCVQAGSNAIDASANPVGSVTVHVRDGDVHLHLQSTDDGHWYVEGIATSFPVPPVSARPLKRGAVTPCR
jgi:hypothetical protein